MAAARLSEGQKSELVKRFRDGDTTAELAEAFGCSPNTITRTVKALLDPADYERLKRQRTRRSRSAAESTPEPAPSSDGERQTTPPHSVTAPPQTPASEAVTVAMAAAEPMAGEEMGETADAGEDDGPGVLAIDDADDFGDAAEDDDSDALLDDEEGDGPDGSDDQAASVFQAIPVVQTVDDHAVPEAIPLSEAQLPGNAYMLVDKLVELQARPLSEFPELGRLPEQELSRQALMLFLNPRQAKRQCGRSQRVIKLPDPRLLERTAPYLLAQGISRVVIEGTLYALPGS